MILLALFGALAVTLGILIPLVSKEADAQRSVTQLDEHGIIELGGCESNNRYGIDTGNGFYGRVQWTQGTWNWIMRELGQSQYVGVRPNLAPPSLQDQATFYLANGPPCYPSPEGHGPEQFGLQHWPTCRYRITGNPVVNCSFNPQADPERCIEMGPDSFELLPAPVPEFTG